MVLETLKCVDFKRVAFARSCYDFIEDIGGHTSVDLQIDERCVQDELLEGDMGPGGARIRTDNLRDVSIQLAGLKSRRLSLFLRRAGEVSGLATALGVQVVYLS